LDDALRVDRQGSRLRFGIREVEHQRLNVTVEDEADNLTVAVDDGAAAVAADDVGRADEVERHAQFKLALAVDPALRQIKRRLVLVLLRPPVQPLKGRLERHLLTVLLVPLYDAV